MQTQAPINMIKSVFKKIKCSNANTVVYTLDKQVDCSQIDIKNTLKQSTNHP